MTAPGVARPLCPWTPPLSGGELATVLDRLRSWTVFDGGALLDDVAAALDDVPPDDEQADEVAQRLRVHLTQLVTIAVAAEEDQRDASTALLVLQARTLSTQDMPIGRWKAVGYLRRMGWTLNNLLERLVAVNCVKEAA